MIDPVWLQDWLLRLKQAVKDRDPFARGPLLAEARGKPGCEGLVVAVDFMLDMVDDEASAAKVAMQLAERFSAMRSVSISVDGNLTVESGGVVGIEASTGKLVIRKNQ